MIKSLDSLCIHSDGKGITDPIFKHIIPHDINQEVLNFRAELDKETDADKDVARKTKALIDYAARSQRAINEHANEFKEINMLYQKKLRSRRYIESLQEGQPTAPKRSRRKSARALQNSVAAPIKNLNALLLKNRERSDRTPVPLRHSRPPGV